MATGEIATVPQKGFMDFPPEMRNMIYQAMISDTWDSPTIATDKLNCSSIFNLVLSLGLHERFPLLATSKQVMLEAFEFCLEKCTFRLENLDQLNAIRAVRHTSNFQQLSAKIHAVTLNISWYGHGIDNPRHYPPIDLYQTETLIPLPPLDIRCPCHGPDPCPLNPFADLIAELALLFPNIASLTIDLDQTTLSMHNKLKRDVLGTPWPTLRKVKFRRWDLERRFAKATEQMVLFSRHNRHPAAVWPPQEVPWALEMDCRFVESINERFEKDMRRKVENGGAAVAAVLGSGPS